MIANRYSRPEHRSEKLTVRGPDRRSQRPPPLKRSSVGTDRRIPVLAQTARCAPGRVGDPCEGPPFRRDRLTAAVAALKARRSTTDGLSRTGLLSRHGRSARSATLRPAQTGRGEPVSPVRTRRAVTRTDGLAQPNTKYRSVSALTSLREGEGGSRGASEQRGNPGEPRQRDQRQFHRGQL